MLCAIRTPEIWTRTIPWVIEAGLTTAAGTTIEQECARRLLHHRDLTGDSRLGVSERLRRRRERTGRHHFVHHTQTDHCHFAHGPILPCEGSMSDIPIHRL